MKKFATVAVIVVFLFTFSAVNVHGNDDIKVTINGFLIKFEDVKPIIIDGRTMVPVRGVFENLNARVRWFPEEKAVLIMKETLQIYFRINDKKVSVSQEGDFLLDVPATIVNGRTMVPLRFIAETLGANVSWDAKNRTVEINIPRYPFAYIEEIGLELLAEKYQDNIEWLMGAPLEYVEHILGKPDRIDLSRYGFDWYVYNSDLEKYLMVGIKNKVVVGIYTNSLHYKINGTIGYNSSIEEVREFFGRPAPPTIIKGNKGYVTSEINSDGKTEFQTYDVEKRYYATIFHDIHNEERVTSFMLIDYATEHSLHGYYGTPSKELVESYERQLFDLANTVRKRYNKPLLTFDEKASAAARMHSIDMTQNNFFDHMNLRGQSPFDRLKNAGINYRNAAENIATGQMCAIFAHEALMNSKKGHRDNILGNFTHIGIGVSLDSDGTPMYTQKFYTPLKSKISFFKIYN
ncbi:stalk domain-containing protein [Acetivibrio saccincola]|jgi:uncharacterized protein YkwD|uniref:stalk domain-containing protein n=1 Tax=Acetivibrio saccincola TaxID=1677857 RepID=UPI0016BD16EE|nr:CAP-associated domain-containing protein [Acetivibrio saccincola]NLW26831.1 copper amine oxidase [Acetivibrio saccincola]